MFDTKTGNITIDNKDSIIGRELTYDEFIQSDLFNDVLAKSNPWGFAFHIKPQSVCGCRFLVYICFNTDGLLDSVTLSLNDYDSSGGLIDTWENWSKDKELLKNELHNRWLKKNIGNPPYKYSWGSILSIYDNKSATSSIKIQYSVC